MSLDIQGLHKLIDDWVSQQTVADLEVPTISPENTEEVPVRVLPEGKRVVRTKSSGDRVYQLDEEKKLRQWVTTGDILTQLGWEQADVSTVEDVELLRYQMGPAIYKVDNA